MGLAFGLVPGIASGRILAKDSGRTPPPGPKGLRNWEGSAVLTPRASASWRVAYPIPAVGGAWEVDRTRNGVNGVGILEDSGSKLLCKGH